MNVADVLALHAQRDPERVALVVEPERFTYAELDRLTGRLAGGLSRLRIACGDRVALLLPNGSAFVLAYFALQKLGAVAVSINAMNTQREVAHVLGDSGARAIVVDASLLDRLPPDAKLHVIVANGLPGREPRLEDLTVDSEPLPARSLAADAPAAILYTSGTTGTPKGATLSVGNIVTNAAAAAECYGATSEARFLLYLPLFHCFAQNAIMNAAFALGAGILLQRRFVAEDVVAAARGAAFTHFFAVPSVYVRLLQLDMAEALRDVEYVFSAAAPLSLEVFRRWRALTGQTIHEGYGMTETAPFATYNHRSAHRAGSVGTPVTDVRVRVVDPAGAELSPGELGEIEVMGPNVMLGYWNRPEDTAACIRERWMRTGDLGRMDADGYLYIVDRLKDMINVSGFKVFPSEVENVLHEHPAIAEPAVFGVPDARAGEAVHACIVLKPGCTLGSRDLERFCAERLATYKIPKQIRFVEALPKNPAGKILRRELRDLAAAHPNPT
jgi:long-chain acyl-CoA synthetase